MVCPQCKAEYLSHVLRCSDCGMELVASLTESPGRTQLRPERHLRFAMQMVPLFTVVVLGLVLMIQVVRGKRNQICDGILVRTPLYDDFYSGATACSVTGTPWHLYSNPTFELVTGVDVDSLSHRVLGVYKVRFVGDVSPIGIHGKYWREVTVKTPLEVQQLDSCKNIEQMPAYR